MARARPPPHEVCDGLRGLCRGASAIACQSYVRSAIKVRNDFLGRQHALVDQQADKGRESPDLAGQYCGNDGD
jgi:hypothetical protein